jgi:hypothetical protein
VPATAISTVPDICKHLEVQGKWLSLATGQWVQTWTVSWAEREERPHLGLIISDPLTNLGHAGGLAALPQKIRTCRCRQPGVQDRKLESHNQRALETQGLPRLS